MTLRYLTVAWVLLASCTTDGWTYRAYPDATAKSDAADADAPADAADADGAADTPPTVDADAPDAAPPSDAPDATPPSDAPDAAPPSDAPDADAPADAGLTLSGAISSAGSSVAGSLRVTGNFEGTGRVCVPPLCVAGSLGP